MQATTEHMDKVANSLMQACNDMNKIARDTLSAALQSATVVTKGCEELCESMNTMTQNALSSGMKAGQAMMGAKTVRDLMDTHTNLMKNGFDSMMSEMSKITQISTRIAQQAAEPVANQVNAAISKATARKAA